LFCLTASWLVFDSLMRERGKMFSEAVLEMEREKKAGPDHPSSGPLPSDLQAVRPLTPVPSVPRPNILHLFCLT